MKELKVFLFMPSAYQKGKYGHTKPFIVETEAACISFIRKSFKKSGFQDVTIHMYNPCRHNWNAEWTEYVEDADLHVYFAPKGHSNTAGRGYYDNYNKYVDTPSVILYKRMHDDTFNFYGIDTMKKKSNPPNWDSYADLHFSGLLNVSDIASECKIGFKGEPTLDLPESLEKYRDYQVQDVYHCVL